jgi:aspartate aminotransferase
MRFSPRIGSIPASATLAVAARARELKAKGEPVIDLSVGEPDFPTPDHIAQAGIRAIQEHKTRYTPAAGLLELRAAFAGWLGREYGLQYKPSATIVSCGAKHSIYNALAAVALEGDEVIVVHPYWVSYPAQVAAVGAKAVIVKTREEAGFKLTPDLLRSATTDRTRAIILNTPCNPTGAVYSAEELRALARVLASTSVVVIFDEIYSKLVFGKQAHVNLVAVAPELRDQTVIVNGASKAFAMTGWRIGLAAGPEPLITVMANFQSHTTSNPCTISQYACLAALTGDQKPVEQMRLEFERRGHRMRELLLEIPGITCAAADGAFYLFPRISAYLGKTIAGKRIGSALDLSSLLLEEAKLATVAGTEFGDDEYLRLSYAIDIRLLEEAAGRLKGFLAQAR